MKKLIFFALAALTLAFTACEGNGPSDPKNINPKDYVGTSWYLDSVDMGSYVSTHMSTPIFLLSETDIQIGNDTCEYAYANGKLTILFESAISSIPQVYELISLDSKGAVLQEGQGTLHVSALPLLDYNKQSAVSEAAVIGKYKNLYGFMIETYPDGKKIVSYSTGGLLQWITFREDHKMQFEEYSLYPNPTNGYWVLDDSNKKIKYGNLPSYSDLVAWNHWEDIFVFNDDYLVTGSDYDYDPNTFGFSHRHYESVLLRVK